MKHFSCLLAATLFSCSFAYGDNRADSTKQATPQYHRISFGPDIFCNPGRAAYRSQETSAHISANTVFGGLRIGYDYVKPRAFYFGMDGLAAIGKGSVTTTETYHVYHPFFPRIPYTFHQKKKIEPLFTNLEQRYGYTFQSAFTAKSNLIPFAGIGFYYIRERFNQKSSFQDWFYIAAGLRMSQQFSKNFNVGCNLKAMYDFFGQTRFFGFIHTGRNSMWGYEIALPCTLLVGTSKKWNLQFQPYLLKLSINSAQQIFGLRVLAGYSF